MKEDFTWLKSLRVRKQASVPFNYKGYMLDNKISDIMLAEILGISKMGTYAMIRRGTIKRVYLNHLNNAEQYIIKQ